MFQVPDDAKLIVTGLAATDAGILYLGNVDDLITLNALNGRSSEACKDAFRFATGVKVDSAGNLIVSDGASYDEPLDHTIYRIVDPTVEPGCVFSFILHYWDVTGIDVVP
jgi:hypothetical protein